MKKIVTYIALGLLVGYIAFATIALSNKPKEQVCLGIRLEIRDSLKTGYMTTADIATLLRKSDLDPTGRPLDEVSLKKIEEALEASPLIADGECYKTLRGHIVVKVECRRPILHIMPIGANNYYLDEEGEIIEHIAKAVYVPVATGHITREYAHTKLLKLAQFLQNNELWNAQIEQIYVTQQGNIELTPRIGNHTIILGRPDNYEYKFDKLQAFYEKALPQVGWDRYSHINLDYSNQVVATKKKTK